MLRLLFIILAAVTATTFAMDSVAILSSAMADRHIIPFTGFDGE